MDGPNAAWEREWLEAHASAFAVLDAIGAEQLLEIRARVARAIED